VGDIKARGPEGYRGWILEDSTWSTGHALKIDILSKLFHYVTVVHLL